jgi:Flp pilus assembly protein TadG
MTTRRSCDPLALLGDDSASTSAEFALIVPLFLILVFGTINGSAMLSAATQMHYAAERAARCLSVDVAGNCSAGAIDAYAKSFYDGPALTGMNFAATAPACGNQVIGTGTYELFSGVAATSVSMSATACYPKI